MWRSFVFYGVANVKRFQRLSCCYCFSFCHTIFVLIFLFICFNKAFLIFCRCCFIKIFIFIFIFSAIQIGFFSLSVSLFMQIIHSLIYFVCCNSCRLNYIKCAWFWCRVAYSVQISQRSVFTLPSGCFFLNVFQTTCLLFYIPGVWQQCFYFCMRSHIPLRCF